MKRGGYQSPYFEMRRQLIYEALDKYPDHGSMTLAKVIYSQHPEFFKNVEHIRTMIRHYRGSNGEYNLNKLRNRKYVKSVQPS